MYHLKFTSVLDTAWTVVAGLALSPHFLTVAVIDPSSINVMIGLGVVGVGLVGTKVLEIYQAYLKIRDGSSTGKLEACLARENDFHQTVEFNRSRITTLSKMVLDQQAVIDSMQATISRIATHHDDKAPPPTAKP